MINLEAKSPIINGLMVEIPMFCLCDVRVLKLALTACLSGQQLSSSPWEKASSVCVTVFVRAWWWKKSAHWGKISDFYGENMLWKKGARQEHLHVHMHNRESIRYKLTSLAAAYFYWTHFLREIASTVSLILQLNQSERRKHTADYCQVCALIFLRSQTPQINYKISLFNTAQDHTHDTEDPSPQGSHQFEIY